VSRRETRDIAGSPNRDRVCGGGFPGDCSLAFPKLLPRTASIRRSALTQIICKCLRGTQSQLTLTPVRSRGRSGRVRAERLTFQIPLSSNPAKPRRWKPDGIRREGYLQTRSRDTAFVCVAGPGFETNNLVRPDEHVLGPSLGIRRVSGNFLPHSYRQLPGNAEPPARPQNTVRTWPTVSEHRRSSFLRVRISLLYT